MPNPVVPGRARVRGRVRAVSKGCNSVFGERLGMVEQVSRPQRLWPGLVLLLSPAALVGGLSTPAVAQVAQCVDPPITSNTAGATLTNNGCIATSGLFEIGIVSSGTNATITNSGTIRPVP